MSTVGLVDKLELFAANPAAPHLALSLHATTDEVRVCETGMLLTHSLAYQHTWSHSLP